MLAFPQEVLNVLNAFASLFSKPVWYNAPVLTIGAIPATRNRTVTSALRVMGLKDEKRFCNYHRVLNLAKWNTLQGSKILSGLLIRIIPAGPLVIAIDETIERRKGKNIKAKGCYRDAVRSAKKEVVKCFGLKRISMMLIVPLPWTKRTWALPFLTVPAPSKNCDEAGNKRHKTTVDRASRMIMQVRRWLPYRAIVLAGDGAYACVSPALCCTGFRNPVHPVSRLRSDAALYDFPSEDLPAKRGPKPEKGKRLRSLKERIDDPATTWSSIGIVRYDGCLRTSEMFSGVSLWYTPGYDPIPIRWVVVRDPKGVPETQVFFSTKTDAAEAEIIRWFILRWNIEVTFEELRAHLGVETRRQWSDKAIVRSTPCLFSLFSIVVLMAIEILKGKAMPTTNCAWYSKSEATFSDAIALVRRQIWRSRYFTNSSRKGDFSDSEDDFFKIMIDTLCYGT